MYCPSTDIAIQNPGDSEEAFPPGSTIIISINEIIPDSEHQVDK
jgi:hypothetical protein